jgi:secondary thiamine-phosphate synthase enzyme
MHDAAGFALDSTGGGMKGKKLTVSTTRKIERKDITGEVGKAVADLEHGFVVVSVPHTTAAVTIGENWDPDVGTDVERALAKWVPDVPFEHGEGNSAAHFLSEAIGNARLLKVEEGKLRLGRWQGVFLLELDGPRERTVHVDALEAPEARGRRS